MASMTVGGILAVQTCQPVQLRLDGGQFVAQCRRKESLSGAAFLVVRADLAPAAQQAIFMARLAAQVVQALAKL